VVPDWASEDRDDGHDGWLMLALTGHSDAPVPVILESADGVSWRLRGGLKFDGDPGFLEGEVPATSPIPPVVSPRLVRLRDEVDGNIYDVL
ncbi:UNVERIFIED_CONTAM: glycoside hydrolase family 32 protein, partial [Bacteroidetes bacterium 56_B9]